MKRAFLRSLLCCLSVGSVIAHSQAQAQAPANPGGERDRMARERAAAEARFAQQRNECQNRFAVTDCVDHARRERREALEPLRRQANALDDAQRKQRAALRLEGARNREGAAQAREREVVVREAPAVPRRVAPASVDESASAPLRETKQQPAPKRVSAHAPRVPPTSAERGAREADAQARAEERKQSAQAHRDLVQQRNAQRALSGKQADPLPLPASAVVP